MTDIRLEVDAVERQVGEPRTVTISKAYGTTVEDLWDACTNPERIQRWFLPVTGDLRVGGRYQLQGNAAGTIESCDPPHGFSATWEYGGDVSRIEVGLTPAPGGRARLTLRHHVSGDDPKWAEFGPGAVGVGWDLALLGLSWHVAAGAAGAAVDPAEGAGWMASDEGKQFITLSSQCWREAHVAAGAPRAEAAGAADRTTAAYTGAG